MSDRAANANRSKAYMRQRERAEEELAMKRKKIEEQSDKSQNIAGKVWFKLFSDLSLEHK